MDEKIEDIDFFGLEKKIFEITDSLETDIIKFVEPTNSVSQKKRFFDALKKGEIVNPRFTYLPKNPIFTHFTIAPEYLKIKKELEAIEIENSGIGRLLNKKKKESLARMEFIRSIGSNEFQEKSRDFYGKPGRKIIARAFEVINSKKNKCEKKSISSEKTAELIHSELLKRKLDWSVIVDENISPNAVVLPKNKVLKIRGQTMFSKADIQRLVVHEIETHIYRHLNGIQQPFRLFIEGPSTEWLKTEEGLAVINESIFGLLEEEQLRNYAGRVIAIDFARRNSFYQTYKYLSEFFTPAQAYQLTQRAKRGMNDTALPGAFTKDYFYFKGAIEVKEFIENSGELRKLYYGKLSIEDVKELDGIPRLSKPRFLPKYPKRLGKKVKFF